MSDNTTDRGASAETARTSLWVWPAITGAAAVVAALLLARIRPEDGSLPDSLWPGDVQSASTVLQVVATAVMTAITLTFSVTVVALQLASQQFSPRLLREFARDPVTKRVLSVLSATFLFAITVLRDLDGDRPVPTVAVTVGYLLGIASLGSIVAFIAHITRALRVDTMMLAVHDETEDAIFAFYPEHGDPSVRSGDELELDEEAGWLVLAASSGFVQKTDVPGLIDCARAHDVFIRVESRPGDHVVRGAPLATAWWDTGGRHDRAAVEERVRAAISLGFERTLDQDAGFGFRQLEDIAVKAMSPSINDPVTATHAVGHMGDLLVRLASRRLGPTLHHDGDGIPRAIVPDRDLRYYLDLACSQLRRFGAEEPTVLVALLRMLRDVAVACRDDEQRAEVRRAADLVAGQVPDSLPDHDIQTVVTMRDRVSSALDGDLRSAYVDRVGETRSI
jgi:uncharacterized membrane protein